VCYNLITAASSDKLVFSVHAQAIILESNVMSPIQEQKKLFLQTNLRNLLVFVQGLEGPETNIRDTEQGSMAC